MSFAPTCLQAQSYLTVRCYWGILGVAFVRESLHWWDNRAKWSLACAWLTSSTRLVTVIHVCNWGEHRCIVSGIQLRRKTVHSENRVEVQWSCLPLARKLGHITGHLVRGNCVRHGFTMPLDRYGQNQACTWMMVLMHAHGLVDPWVRVAKLCPMCASVKWKTRPFAH